MEGEVERLRAEYHQSTGRQDVSVGQMFEFHLYPLGMRLEVRGQ